MRGALAKRPRRLVTVFRPMWTVLFQVALPYRDIDAAAARYFGPGFETWLQISYETGEFICVLPVLAGWHGILKVLVAVVALDTLKKSA